MFCCVVFLERSRMAGRMEAKLAWQWALKMFQSAFGMFQVSLGGVSGEETEGGSQVQVSGEWSDAMFILFMERWKRCGWLQSARSMMEFWCVGACGVSRAFNTCMWCCVSMLCRCLAFAVVTESPK